MSDLLEGDDRAAARSILLAVPLAALVWGIAGLAAWLVARACGLAG